MTAKECTQHRWLQRDELLMEITPTPPKSPFGSPIGQRRALTPTTPDSSLELEPTKKCRCDSGNTSTNSGEDVYIILLETKLLLDPPWKYW